MYWTSCTVAKCLTMPVVCAAALLVGCDSDREPTGPTVSPGGGSQQEGSGLQADLGVVTDAPDWVGTALTAPEMLQSDDGSTHEELPGLGHKFKLFFAMHDDQDPQNTTNDVIAVTTTPVTIGLAVRNLPPGIKITAFDTQLGFKYYFENRSCGGGSPRVTLLVDADGDGDFDQDPPTSIPDDPDDSPDFAAHGHPNPFVGCPMNEWVYENLTDNGPRWEITPGGSVVGIPTFPFVTWDVLEAAVTTQFPNHRVIRGSLVDDSCSFSLASCGDANYDLLTIENRTLENDQDTIH